MVRKNKDKSEYIHCADVEKFKVSNIGVIEKELFGRKVMLYDDPWMWHLHIKLTNKCNARCSFCSEKGCREIENTEKFFQNLNSMLQEMSNAGILYSVSVTGGEPTLFPMFKKLCSELEKYDIKFLTLNTNGCKVFDYLNIIDGFFDYIDVSRHAISDTENNSIFKTSVIGVEELKKLKENLKKTKMRIQCVLNSVNSPADCERFINEFSFADDISFRRLMILNDEYEARYQINGQTYNNILEYFFKNYKFIEQIIQDQYVYEVYETGKTKITFSYANMKHLRKIEAEEPDNKFREFIVHPNGVVSGSWKMDKKILLT